MQNENIFEVNEVKSVNITESKLTELFAEATNRIIDRSKKSIDGESDADIGKFVLVTMLTGAKFHSELVHLLFDEDSDT